MSAHVVRDWRGIKFKVSEYSTDELIALRRNTVHTHDQLRRFLDEIDAELVARAAMPSSAPSPRVARLL